MRILVIEHDTDLRALLKECLSESPADVVAAAGPEGLGGTALGPERFDVAFTDLVPLRTYDEAAARSWVAQVRRLAGRVVVVTGQAGAMSAGAAALGADLVVAKPFDLEAILAAASPVTV